MKKDVIATMLLSRISTAEKFSRQDYILAYKDQFGESNIYTIEYALRKAVSKGEIIHVGRDQFAVSDKRRNYQYKYSEAAVQIASVIREEYPNVDVMNILPIEKRIFFRFEY